MVQQKNQTKEFLYRYRHAWILSYFIIYIVWFSYVEKTVTTRFHIITLPVDLKIPFCEYFIIPYLLWFAYVAFGVLFFFFKNKEDYYRLCAFLFTGMTIFLIVSTLYPNGHYLRPTEFVRDNWCTRLVSWLYATDTATNLFPSIHVYNSLGIHLAFHHSSCLQNKKAAKACSLILCVSIIAATMLLKQHSVFDVMTAFGLAIVMNHVVYGPVYQRVSAAVLVRMERRKKRELLHDWRM